MNVYARASTSSSSSSSPFPSPFSRHNTADRDVLAQRSLLGDSAFCDEVESPIATPSPVINQLSPLSVATHLIADNPFLSIDDHPDTDAGRPPIVFAHSASPAAPLRQHIGPSQRQSRHHRQPPRSSLSSSSGLGLDARVEEEDPHFHRQARVARQAPRSPSRQSATMDSPVALPTIQETTRTTPPVPPRRRVQPAMNTYALPPAAEDAMRPSPSQPTWRRPSPFPLGPVPPPLPSRRQRQEPQPHIVDIAVERFKINTHTLSYNPSSTMPAKSAQQNERERQWEKWESERIRAQQMTNEAAKNNRVQAPRSNASSRTTTTTSSATSEPKPRPATVKKPKRSWWCFGGGAVESDREEDEKRQYSREARRRSVSSLDDVVDSDEEEEDEEDEWNEARTASGAGLLSNLGLSCSKSRSARKGATLKKKAQ